MKHQINESALQQVDQKDGECNSKPLGKMRNGGRLRKNERGSGNKAKYAYEKKQVNSKSSQMYRMGGFA